MANDSNRTPNLRVQWFHRKVLEMAYPNAMRLSERFGISHRQAQRDVELMIRKLNAPLAYNAEHRGYYYEKEYTLPVVFGTDNDELYTMDTDCQNDLTLFGAESSVVQLQMPYTATIELSNRLSALELNKFIVSRQGQNAYLCEFHRAEAFIAALLTADTDVHIIEPDWLREKLVSVARRILLANEDQPS